MDKKTAFKILNIDESATFEQAKKAYHAMAKKYHPDMDKTNHGSPKDLEDRMKKINLAFCYLAPVLKSIQKVKNPEEELKKPRGKIKKKNQPKKTNTSKKSINSFFHDIFDSLSRTFINRKKNKKSTQNIKTKQSVKKTNIKQTGFDTILKNAHHGVCINKIRKTSRRKNSSYNIYKEYMMLKKKIRYGQSKTDQSMGIGKVEKIHPVRPIDPVGRY